MFIFCLCPDLITGWICVSPDDDGPVTALNNVNVLCNCLCSPGAHQDLADDTRPDYYG